VLVVASSPLKAGQKHVYGKYFTKAGDNEVNTMFLYRPTNGAVGQVPTVVYFHPGGFEHGSPEPFANDKINAWNHFGFAYLSVGYRLIVPRYYYQGANGSTMLEELVLVGSDGSLSLDKKRTMADYKVYSSRQEVITKCMYDAVQAMNFIIQNQVALGVDPRRLIFQTGSAGTGISSYLTWVYQRLNPSFHSIAVLYEMSQFIYPATGLLQHLGGFLAEHMVLGTATPLSDLMHPMSCKAEMCNLACPGMQPEPDPWEYDLCNDTWNWIRLNTFCVGDAFRSKTLADAMASEAYVRSNWPEESWSQLENLKRLWHNDVNIAEYPSGADYVYVANAMNRLTVSALPHKSVFARGFGDACKKAGVNYTAYYTDYTGMTPSTGFKVETATNRNWKQRRLSNPGGRLVDWNYESNIEWRELHATSLKNIDVGSLQELVLFACMAAKQVCDLSTWHFEPAEYSEEHVEEIHV